MDDFESINEPGKSRQSFSPPSINEPTKLPEGDKPTITSLDPSSCVVGDPAFTLDVTGTGFTENSVILMDGLSMTTTFNDETTLSMAVDPVWWPEAKVIPTAVRTGLQTSDPVDFTVTDAPPAKEALATEDPDDLEDEIEQEMEDGDITRVTVTKVHRGTPSKTLPHKRKK